ncbi:MAG TPA: metallophosphoesterase [Planctomycetota bacterium]|nr:metallophosphoesterase [Planctomycetota bacterium]
MKKRLPATLGALLLAAVPAWAQTVTRGPYLQQGHSTSVIVRWRTDTPTDSRVRYGTSAGSLTLQADNAASTTEHEVKLTGLSPNTKYYYSIGTTTRTLAGDAGYFFVTAPTPGTVKPTRIWVIGDAGTANSSQRAVRDAYYSFTGSRYTDLWLMLGDNAYDDGTDAEYQAAVFNMYPTLLRQSVVWPTLGNHDGHSADSATLSGPYYNIFSLPKNGECGGLASGTEAYYSFDYANIHFICLDSYETSRTVGGAMHTWVKNDAAATTRDWIIAFWHHPPYSKGSHNSDSESYLIDMRKNFLPILEEAGVDLVLCGHSHSYERSFLLDGHYGTSSTLTASMKKDGGSGRDPNPYRKSAGTQPHEGAVYVVAGSSGKTSGGSLNHPAMFISLNQLGSLVLDIDGNRLDAKFLRSDGTVGDYFTILKSTTTPPPSGDTTPPTITISSPTTGSSYSTTSSPVTLGGSASDNVGVSQIRWSNAATGSSGVAAGTASWTATVPLNPGSNAITVTAYDAAGNTATDTLTVTYTPPSGDTTPPSISITAPSTTGRYTAASEPVRVSGTASDNVDVVRVSWFNAATGDTGTASGTASWSASIELAAGDNPVTFTAYDAAGNSASARITISYARAASGGSGDADRDEGEEGLAGDRCSMGSAGAAPTAGGALLSILSALLLMRNRPRRDP